MQVFHHSNIMFFCHGSFPKTVLPEATGKPCQNVPIERRNVDYIYSAVKGSGNLHSEIRSDTFYTQRERERECVKL